MQKAFIDEIFSSIQGEGPWMGERHIFARFLGCDIRCRYCDTPAAAPGQGFCRVHTKAGSFDFERVPNPLSASLLTSLCSRLTLPAQARPALSLTGGEPLLQAEFLTEWLPQVRGSYRIYLETCGVHYEAMEALRDMVDVVSMDFKLPSATGLRPYWEEHRKFFGAALGKGLFVKAVVTGDTAVEDITTAARIIAEIDRTVLLVIQPAAGPFAPLPEKLIKFQDAALGIIEDVRVIPQAHKILNVP